MNTKNELIDAALEKLLVSAGFLGANQTLYGTPEPVMAVMRAALLAAVAELAPVGCVLAPLEPTDDMLNAGRRFIHGDGNPRTKSKRIYRAMLAAMPPSNT